MADATELGTRLLDALQSAIAAKLKPVTAALGTLAHAPLNLLELDKPLSHPLTSGPWTGTLGISDAAKLTCAVLANADAAALGVDAADGEAILALALDVSAGLDLQGSYPVGIFAAGAGGSASTGCNVQWLFARPAASNLVTELPAVVRTLSAPFSLSDVRGMARDPSWRQIRLEVTGKADTSLSLSAGWTHTGWTWSASGTQRTPVGVTVGLSGTAQMQMCGTFHLSATRAPGGIRVKLERDAKTSQQFGLELGANADVCAVLDDAACMLAATLPDPSWCGLLMPIVEPMSLLRPELGQAVDELLPDRAQNLLARLSLGLAASSTAGKLTESPLSRIGDAVTAGLQTDAARLGPSLEPVFLSLLPDGLGSDKPRLAGQLSTRVQAWVTSHADIDKLAARCADKFANSGGGKAMAEALGAFGAQVQARLADAAPDAPHIAAAIKAALNDYGVLRKKWIVALTTAAQAKLGLCVGAQHVQGNGADTLLELVFLDDCGPEAEELYAALARGHLDELSTRLQAAGQGVTLLSRTLVDRLNDTAKTDISLHLLGQDLQWTDSQAAKLAVTSTLAGSLVATGSADAEAATNTWYGHFDTELACDYALSQPSPNAPITGSLSFQGAYSYQGDSLTWAQLQSLTDSMRPICDLPPLPDLAARLGLPGAASSHLPATLSGLELQLPLILSAPEMAAVARSSLSFTDVARQVIDVADLAYTGGAYPFDFSSPLADIQAAADQLGQPLEAFFNSLTRENIVNQLYPDAADDSLVSKPQRAAAVVWRIVALTRGIQAMRAGMAALASVDVSALGTDKSRQAQVLEILGDTASAMAPAASATQSLLGNEMKMPWALTAFGCVLARLAGRSLPGAFAPIARIQADGSQPARTLVLTRW